MCEDERMKAIPFMAPFLANYRETMPWASKKLYIYSVVENTCNEAKLHDLDETGKGIILAGNDALGSSSTTTHAWNRRLIESRINICAKPYEDEGS
ncbi:hypothetical protein Tco_0159208 [Tanacetum coccineum]